MTLTAQNKTAQDALKQGLAQQAAKNYDEAMECFETAVTIDPAFSPAYAAAADLFMIGELHLQALDCYGCAIQNDRANLQYKDSFISALQKLELKNINDQIADIVLDCLNAPETDVYFMGRAWKNILDVSPEFKPLQALLKREDYDAFCKAVKKADNLTFLTHPLFLKGLERLRVPDMRFEKFLVNLRRLLLENITQQRKDFEEEALLDLTKSLAHYCFATDYVFTVSEQENQILADINISEAAGIAICACYQPLISCEGITENKGAKSMKGLFKLQVTDILEQRQIAEELPALTEISEGVSEKVRAQYETLPYPRWRTFSKTTYKEDIEGTLRNKNAKILNAGCGTGHEAAELAAVFPDADILAVDLSRTSLSYGAQKTKEHGLGNITFKHGDILELAKLNEEFDFITASGVLHHMDDPLAGWKVLTDILKPGGLMRIALYSRIARKSIAEAREVIEKHGYTPDPKSVRDFRHECKKLLSKQAYEKITDSQEFYALSECVDLLFHAQEHQLTLPEINQWLQELNLEFLGFQVTDKVVDLYRQIFPDDIEAKNLENWGKFETEKHPDLFIGMYRFWCRKN